MLCLGSRVEIHHGSRGMGEKKFRSFYCLMDSGHAVSQIMPLEGSGLFAFRESTLLAYQIRGFYEF